MWLIENYGAQTHKDKKKQLVTKIQIMDIFRFNDDLHNEILQFFTFFTSIGQNKTPKKFYDCIWLNFPFIHVIRT